MSLRLILLAGIAIAFLSLGGLALYWRGNAIAATAERDKAYADLRVAVDANRTNLEAIAQLKAQAERDAEITLELAQTNAELHAAAAESSAEFARLKEGNPDVRSYLDAPVPADLRRLYDRGSSKGGGAH